MAVINWLSPLNFFTTQNDTLRRRQDGTGGWLLETPEFEAWLAGTDRILWCSGLRKSTLIFEKIKLTSFQLEQAKPFLRIIAYYIALLELTISRSAIIDKLQTQLSPPNVGLAFAYCDYKERDSQTLVNLIASLVQQLVQCYNTVPDEVRTAYTKYLSRNIRPGDEEFSKILQSLIAKFSHVYVVVDALDECGQKTRNKFIERLQESPQNLHLLCTSRHLGDIQEAFSEASHLEIRASDAECRAIPRGTDLAGA